MSLPGPMDFKALGRHEKCSSQGRQGCGAETYRLIAMSDIAGTFQFSFAGCFL